jgi:hypothetical protein
MASEHKPKRDWSRKGYIRMAIKEYLNATAKRQDSQAKLLPEAHP